MCADEKSLKASLEKQLASCIEGLGCCAQELDITVWSAAGSRNRDLICADIVKDVDMY